MDRVEGKINKKILTFVVGILILVPCNFVNFASVNKVLKIDNISSKMRGGASNKK